MAGVITIAGAAIAVEALFMLLLLACIVLSLWLQNGGAEALSRIICQIGETIGDFFSGLWNWWKDDDWPWITDVAVPWVCTTAVSVGDAIADKYKKAKAKVEDWAKSIAKEATQGHYKVYQLLMKKPGYPYPENTWGYGFNKIHKYEEGENPTYKYGTTKNTIEQRYGHSGSIGSLLDNGLLIGYDTYILQNVNKEIAYATETSLIMGYVYLYGKFPPGNSKFG